MRLAYDAGPLTVVSVTVEPCGSGESLARASTTVLASSISVNLKVSSDEAASRNDIKLDVTM